MLENKPAQEGISRTDGKWLRAFWQMGAILIVGALMGFAANSLRQAGMPLVSDWSIKAQLVSTKTADTGENVVISLEDAEVLYFDHGAVFLDARPESLYRTGHIEGSLNLPWEDYESHLQDVMANISKDTKIITYCDGESCSLSKELAMVLMAKGYKHVRVLVNGWTVWVQANLPTDG